MFYYLAAPLKLAFKWFSMFDLDQTFSPNDLPCEQMFDRLSTTANKACARGKRNQSETSHVVIFSSNTRKKVMTAHLGLSNVWSNIVCPFSHRTVCLANTILDENV